MAAAKGAGKTPIQLLLRRLVQTPESITPEDAYNGINYIMNGEATPSQTASFLTALRAHKIDYRPDIVAACGRAMRQQARSVPLQTTNLRSTDIVDIVGTGGDGQDTFNVSTAAGIVASAVGVKVAKHGNRASSSSSGSADMLEALGCRIADITPERAAHLLSEQGYCFLFAQTYHPAMRHVAPVRRELAIPTVFNLLGPLVNPARPGRMVVGVAHESLGDLMIEALRLTGVHRAFVVCGEEGLDEISPAGKTHVWSLENGNITRFTVHPSDFGLPTHSLDKVRGGDAAHNAQIFREILSGQRQDAMLDYVLLNTAALLVVAGRANHWKEGVEQAREAIQSGKAKQMLEKFIHTTKQTDHA